MNENTNEAKLRTALLQLIMFDDPFASDKVEHLRNLRNQMATLPIVSGVRSHEWKRKNEALSVLIETHPDNRDNALTEQTAYERTEFACVWCVDGERVLVKCEFTPDGEDNYVLSFESRPNGTRLFRVELGFDSNAERDAAFNAVTLDIIESHIASSRLMQ